MSMKRSWRWSAALVTLWGCADATGPSQRVPEAIQVSADAVAVESLGDTIRLTATVVDRGGQPMSGVPVVWRLEREGVLAPTGVPGTFVSVATGEVRVWAELRDAGGTVQPDRGYSAIGAATPVAVRVTQRPRVLTLTGAGTLWSLGATTQFAATAVDGRGTALAVAPIVRWATSDALVATVDDMGVVRALRDGTVQISATVDGVRSERSLRVSAGIPLSVCALVDGVAEPSCTGLQLTVTERGS